MQNKQYYIIHAFPNVTENDINFPSSPGTRTISKMLGIKTQ